MYTDMEQHQLNNAKTILSCKYTKKDEIYSFKKNDGTIVKFPKDEVESSVKNMYDSIKDTYDELKTNDVLMGLLVIGARIKERFDFEGINKQILEDVENIRNRNENNFVRSALDIFDKNTMDNIIKPLLELYTDIDNITMYEGFYIITEFVGKDVFKRNKDSFLEKSILNKDVTISLLELEFVDSNDIRTSIHKYTKEQIITMFKAFKNRLFFWLDYLEPELIFELFDLKIIDEKIISKYISMERLISEKTDKDLIMKFIMKKLVNQKCEMDLWNLYESNYFSEKEMDTIIKFGYVNPRNIIKKYKQAQKRDIAVALEEIPEIRAESLAKFLSPQRIISLENSNRADRYNEESKQFVRSELREIYFTQGRDLELDLLQEQKRRNEAQEDKSKQKPLIDLYKSGLISLSKFEEDDISLDEIIKYYEENKNPNILIEANNTGILSDSDLVELLGDFDKIFDLIEKGLNPTILNEFCGVQDILELYKTKKVSTENLSKLTINVDNVKNLYVAEKIEYEDLDILYRIGLITIEERSQIEQEYDIESKLKELREIGILGKDSSELQGPDYGNTAIGNEFSKPTSKMSKEEKILSDAKVILFKRLGASKPVNVKCDLFKDYIMYPIIDKRLAIFEGKNGATYIFPLKVVLEQVGKDLNYIKEKDVIGQAENNYIIMKHLQEELFTLIIGEFK